jgi:diguanylate cyclase (GGDEF)-like protein
LPVFLLVPPPAGAILFTALAATGLGHGLVGPSGPGRRSLLAVAGAGVVAQTVAIGLPPSLATEPWGLAAALALLHLVVQAAAYLLAALVGTVLRGEGLAAFRPSRTRALLEASNVPLAWLLVETAREGRLPELLVAALAVVASAALAARHADSRATAAEAERTLASRSAELAVLQSLAREILTSVDTDRLFRIVERECRKILPCDFFFLATVDRETGDLRAHFRGEADTPARMANLPADDGLAVWVVRERRPVRIDDFQDPEAPIPFRPRIADPAIRSALAVPLLVDDRAVGVLSVQSRDAAAFDEHQLELLQTIGHQAAVAIENARHFELATTDSLTGLLARDTFFARLEEEYQRAQRYRLGFAVLMVDIDRFKEINDRHGHPAGDRYLRAFGGAIRRVLRAADVASRYGGDEFCLLLPETDLASAHQIAERLRRSLAALQIESGALVLHSTVSIGIAAYPEHDGGDVRTLLLRADQALYRAKRDGRDRVVPFAA